MASGASIDRGQRAAIAAIVTLVLLAGVVIGAMAITKASEIAEQEVRARARETLSVQVQALSGLTEKFRLLPNLVSRYTPVRDFLHKAHAGVPVTADERASLQRLLLQLTAVSGAIEIGLLSPDGEPLLAAIGSAPFRLEEDSQALEAVKQARLGREVRWIGPRDRAYAFAHGFRDDQGSLLGIVAVLIDFDILEQAWSLTTDPVFVADQFGTIIATNRESWRMQPLENVREGNAGFSGFIDVARALPQQEWSLHVLADARRIIETRWLIGLASAVICIALAAGLIALTNRRFAQIRRLRKDRAIALRLERLVRDRTRALLDEVEEHKKTSDILSQTQAELVQTGKLAALGQMSTALSHEYNQPLAATRNYAENALVFLEKGNVEQARDNIRRIAGMADRMASIARHLRNFARAPNTSLSDIRISQVIKDALEVLNARIIQADARIEVEGDTNIWVRGGSVRLQQVLVNLVGNALDAMADLPEPVVHISVETTGDMARITVSDSGPGVPEDQFEQVFDPFFTTKGPGEGLGLGLSISYNIVKDFGGAIRVANRDGGGAQFILELRLAEPQLSAAE